ncbi:MAG: M48 family peptidase, partial [Flavobacteriaceae bacterium]|nr:M48 family peptidase [Flavobacteriaceae bacterium]
MDSTTLFYIIIFILVLKFIIDKYVNYLNAKKYNDPLPPELQDVYDKDEYLKSQKYKATNYRFGILSSSISLLVTLLFLCLDGFEYVDNIARTYSDNPIIVALIFFGIITLASDVISIPFSYYRTFVIEERFGFNKTTPKTFVTDKVKGLLMTAIIGGGLLALIVWFYQMTQEDFWLYAWGLVAVFTLFMNMFYAKL